MDQNEKRALAHDYANTILHAMGIGLCDITTMGEVAHGAWQLADAMEKEELKRTDTTRPAVLADPLADPVHQVDWNDAPDWARYLFYDYKSYSVIWSENIPIKNYVPHCKWTAQCKGRTERASNKYNWVLLKSSFFQREY